MILEGLVTTRGADGRPHLAAMGPIVDEAEAPEFRRFTLRPFASSQTFANLKATREGTLHVTDDALLFAQAIVGKAHPAFEPTTSVRGFRLVDCCRFFEFRIVGWDESEPRSRLEAEVTRRESVRDFFGFNRAKHAVLEAAILASRVHLLPRAEIAAEFDRLAVVVSKTGGEREREGFALLRAFVDAADA